MIIVNTHEAKSKLSYLLAAVEKGERVRICRNGRSVADLVPARQHPGDPLRKNPDLSGIVLHYDPVEPLQDDEWPESLR